MTLGPAVPGGRWAEELDQERAQGKQVPHHRERQGVDGEGSYAPAIAQHFTGGIPCSSLPGYSGGQRGRKGGRAGEGGKRSRADGSEDSGGSSGLSDTMRLVSW